jgi:isocitrate dehydrogenase kinase/phosphatase
MAGDPAPTAGLARSGARAIHEAYSEFESRFAEVTRRARERFEICDWRGHQGDALERLELYPRVLQAALDRTRNLLGDRVSSVDLWAEIKRAYASSISAEANDELAETFFNSVTRRVFSTVGVNPEIEFVLEASAVQRREPDPSIYDRFPARTDTRAVIREILDRHRFRADYRDIEDDASRVAAEVDAYLGVLLGSNHLDAIEILSSVFYRNKAAYLIGRIRSRNQIIPLVVPLLNDAGGVFVDAVLLDEAEVSILFSFTRSHFLVVADRPRELIVFLKTIMPLKPIAELYISLGLNRHGKTELYRSLRRHLETSPDRFRLAEGDRGMVMVVFTLPFYDVVFKVIRDEFAYPKTITRHHVMERYRLVFKHDRVGRLVDAQEFEHLKFRKDRFSNELLRELTTVASQTVSIEGNDVVIKHLYTERKLTPLNLYIRNAVERSAEEAVVDYGNATKELAAANIFPGDFLLKNFGVTRHGRVVFYDYDELCLVTDCNFRRLPAARRPEQDLAAEPWFAVGEHDVFPEEFERFLELDGELREAFCRHHRDLFTIEFWRGQQEHHRAGEIMDFFPYPTGKRLRRDGAGRDARERGSG